MLFGCCVWDLIEENNCLHLNVPNLPNGTKRKMKYPNGFIEGILGEFIFANATIHNSSLIRTLLFRLSWGKYRFFSYIRRCTRFSQWKTCRKFGSNVPQMSSVYRKAKFPKKKIMKMLRVF